MKVEFQYFEDCPNWQLAHHRLVHALTLSAPAAELVMVPVETGDDTKRLGFVARPAS